MTHVSSAVRPILQVQTATPITPKKLQFKTENPTKILYCDVVFGSPSMDCNGTGICKITGTNSIRPLLLKKSCQLTKGLIASAPGGKVSLYFFRSLLCVQLYRQHFRSGMLTMKENCPLPAQLTAPLNLTGKQLIAGSYPVVENEGYFRVDIVVA